MSRRTLMSLAASAIVGIVLIATISTDAFARRGGGGGRAGAVFGTGDHTGTGQTMAAYLAATGQMVSSVVTLIVGELLKLVLVERLFSLTRDKLMKIPAFLWAYTKFRQAKAWLEATEAWQAIRAISKAARQYVTEMKKSAAMAFRQS